jgi:phage regulator Rha-like protein
MNKTVQAINNTIDSREIAEMLNMEHYKILEKLEGTRDGRTKGIIPVLTAHDFVVSDYFILSSYKDNSGKENRYYLFTKMGCDFIANKFQGEKGIVFSAKYVKRFVEMETEIKQRLKLLSRAEQLELQLIVMKEQNMKINDIKVNIEELKNNAPLYNIECRELQRLVRRAGIKALGGYKSPAYNDNSLRGKVYADIQRQLKREFGVERYEAIKRAQFEIAKKIIEEYKAPTIFLDEINCANRENIKSC